MGSLGCVPPFWQAITQIGVNTKQWTRGLCWEARVASLPEPCKGTGHTWSRELVQPGRGCSACRLALAVRTHDWPFKCCLLHGQFDYFSFLLFF